ncbi:MAG: aspartate aminotransferase family protein [Myxococcota bacterium]|nr:aspartate aminotransferase family protein [Myxococcota bacterium]
MSDPNASVVERGSDVLVGNYARAPIAVVRGEGCNLFDAAGRRYLDLMGGIATVALGHSHPRVMAALEEQARKLWHVSNLFASEPQIEAAERIVAHSFAERVFFCNSGAEANEAALKLARRWHREHGDDRYEIVAFHGGFHGRTLLTLSATGTPAYWEGFEPLVPGISFAEFGDLASVESVLTDRTAAILVEPVQGESGVRPAPPGFLQGLRELANQNGAILIFDEIQCGIGRTGTLFAYEQHGAVPDVMTLAKALGNGIPIGATCTTERFAKALVPGTHGSTFGGNPLAAACASAVLAELTEGGVLEHAQQVGAWLDDQLAAMAARLGDKVVELRGVGHLRAIELPGPAADVVAACREQGVLVIQAGPNNVRLAPALVITCDELATGLDVLERAIAAC